MTTRGTAYTVVAYDNKLFFCETLSDSSRSVVDEGGQSVLTLRILEQYYRGTEGIFAKYFGEGVITDLLNECPVIKFITPPKGFTPRAVKYHDTELIDGEYKLGSTIVFTYSHMTRVEVDRVVHESSS